MASLPSTGRFSLPDQPFNFLRKHLPSLSEQGIHLLNSLLTYDPEKRITARQALRHPFFQASKPCRRVVAAGADRI